MLHKSLALALSFLILGATTSWTFSSHYCGSIRVDTVLFGHPEDCGMDMLSLFESPNDPTDQTEQSVAEAQAKTSCCNDLDELVAGQSVYKQLQTSFSYPWVATHPSPIWKSFAAIFYESPQASEAYTHPPPLGEIPLYLKYRSILI